MKNIYLTNLNAEIDNLIEMALADGVVIEKEKAIILRKAEKLGEDVDEIEMILEGKIALLKKEQNANQQQFKQKSNKEGDMKKCPSCGSSPTSSFVTKCPDCGHEFRNIEVEKTISDLFNELSIIQNTRHEQGNTVDNFFNNNEAVVTSRQVNTISNFPLPNTKEAIIEFLAQSFSKANSGKKWSWFNEDQFERQIRKVWKAKCEQIIMKARFSMKEDKATLEEIEYYAKQLKIK